MKKLSTLHTILTQSFESERSLRHFSTLASQELITLLASALGDLENSETSFEKTKSSLERAVFLSRNIRYFSSGVRADCSLTDLSQLVFDCIHLRENDFQKKNISLEVRVESSVFGLVDAVAVEQAVLNCLDFASSQSEVGSQVGVNLQVENQGLQLSFSLEGSSKEETGEGLPLQPTAFENLQASNLSVLGLTVASVIAEAHSGTFQCLKSPQEGTQLLLQLPFDARVNKQPHLFREKRRYQRVRVDFSGALSSESGQSFPGRVTVLSAGGCFVALGQEVVSQLKCGDSVSLSLQTDADHVLSIPLARVANTHPTGENSGVGLEFLELDLKAKNLLATLVKAHAS